MSANRSDPKPAVETIAWESYGTVCVSRSPEQTHELGRRIGALARAGQCIALDGQLGSGKTQLVRGIAEGARVADLSLVCSPTYVLLNIYEADPADNASKSICHLDAYRLQGGGDIEAIGFADLLDERAITVIEWASRVADVLPEDHLQIDLELLDPLSRRLTFCANGERSREMLASLHG